MNTLIEKEFEIQQPIDKVWKSLANPMDVVTCVPGASIIEKIDDKNYKGAVVTKFGPIKVSYTGDIEITELDEANYKMVLIGKGLDSKGKGSADMIMNGVLTQGKENTNVKFSMDITIVGKLAQFGSRLIHDVSDQLINQFVENFSNKLSTSNGDEKTSMTESAQPDTPSAQIKNTSVSKKDNALDVKSLFGTVIKSLFGGIINFIKSLFGRKN